MFVNNNYTENIIMNYSNGFMERENTYADTIYWTYSW